MAAFNYDQTEIHRRYDKARSLSKETLDLWLGKLLQHIPQHEVNTIIDLGCGTGRFTPSLARCFAATVIGVDPSAKMMSVARASIERSTPHPQVSFVQGSAENIPVAEQSADLIFLSMVYHHIQHKHRACQEFRRVLKPNCYLCIRTSTREILDSYLWLSFFPEAREIEAQRTDSRPEIISRLVAHNFKLTAHEVVHQEFASDLSEYYRKISQRGLSSLQAIPDQAFHTGLGQLREHCNTHDTGQTIYEPAELFTFMKD